MVDEALLTEIESWRLALAQDLARRQGLGAEALPAAVQQTLNRILFLRICEAWAPHEKSRLRSLLRGPRVSARLARMDPLVEENAPLSLDDEGLRAILRRLYDPESPVARSSWRAESLGEIYERLLGKAIRVDSKGAVSIEEKPLLKKAGGIFYTPPPIVEYIVAHALGPLCEGKTPEQLASIRILDPACGGGVFLLAAYQYLMDWHHDYYLAKGPQGFPHAMVRRGAETWELSRPERARILLNNLYGVDLDAQAVEVTKRALWLKMLEGERSEIGALPALERNIQWGNALLEPDCELDAGLSEQLRAFDWRQGFPEVFSRERPGFDAILGNPPYGYMISEAERRYYAKRYKHQDYQKDLYLLFLERYHELLAEGGALGVIVSNTWLQSLTQNKLRKHLASAYQWRRILLLPEKAFQAVVDTVVLLFEKGEAEEARGTVIVDRRERGQIRRSHLLPQSLIPRDGSVINVAANAQAQALFRRILAESSPLSAVCAVHNGVKPFEKGRGFPPQTETIIQEKPYVVEGARPDASFSPLLRGKLIRRYELLWNHDSWIQYGPWLAAPREPSLFAAPRKIVVRQTSDSLVATIVEAGFIVRNNMHIVLPRPGADLYVVLGILCSRLMDFVYTLMNPEKGEALAEVKKSHIEALPMRLGEEERIGQRIGELVQELLPLYARKNAERNAETRAALVAEGKAIEAEIDALVYALYGLSDDEREIVERFRLP